MNQINPIIVELLAKRGIHGEAEINEFLSEKPQKTYDPFLLPDMEAGVDLLLQAIHGGKKFVYMGIKMLTGLLLSAFSWSFWEL